jgi:hypothetical protein
MVEYFRDNKHTIFNVGTTGKLAKRPITKQGYGLTNWETLTRKELYKEHDLNSKAWGLRLGENTRNNTWMICLDFDISRKHKEGYYYICEDTTNLFKDYEQQFKKDGMFSSSTKTNRNVLLNIIKSEKIKTLLNKHVANKFNLFGLEIIVRSGCQQVIPPTATPCKVSKELRAREFLSDKPIYEIENDDDPIVDWICDKILNSDSLKGVKEKTINKKENEVISFAEINSNKEKTEKDIKILNLIDVKYLDNFEDWKKIMWAMKKENYPKETAKQISKKSNSYTDEGFDNIWDKAPSNITVTQGTLNHYAKLSNEVEYLKLGNENNEKKGIPMEVYLKGALSIAEFIKPKLIKQLIFCEDNWYQVNNKNLWERVREPSAIIIKCVQTYIQNSITYYGNVLSASDEEKQKEIVKTIKEYTNLFGLVDKPGSYSMIKNHLKTILCDNEFLNKLDNNPYFIAYANGILNLKTLEFDYEGIKPEHYLTRTIKFDYQKATENDLDFVKNVLKKICNWNDDHLNYYLSILGYSFLGDAMKEKALFFLVGQDGNNGKTLILDVLMNLTPYVDKLDKRIFEEGFTKTHKTLKKSRGLRIAYFEELKKNKLAIDLMKEMGDGKSIENEIMFGCTEMINIMFKCFFLSNNTPKFEVDGGIKNRFKQLQFDSKFETKFTVDDYHRKEFIQDKDLSEKIEKTYKHALLELIFKAGNEYVKNGKIYEMPNEFQEVTKQTTEINDPFKEWIDDNCEIGEGFKINKTQIKEYFPKMEFIEIKDRMKTLGFKYESQGKYKNVKGYWIGLQLETVTKCKINIDSDTEME